MPERTFLSPGDVAARWNISEGKVRRMLREKLLAGLKVENTWRIPEDAVAAYEELHMTQMVEHLPANRKLPKEPKSVVAQIV